MKKTVKILTMVLALGVSMSTMTYALAEGEDLGAEMQQQEIPQSVEVMVTEEAPKADVVTETQVETAVEVLAEESSEQLVAEENTEVGVEEPAMSELTEIEDHETPLGLFDQSAEFTGQVRIARKGEGTLYYGDQVTLTALVSNANSFYSIRWEVNCNDNAGWRIIPGANGADYSFTLTAANAGYEYRVVLMTAA